MIGAAPPRGASLDGQHGEGALHVFAYGSLIWRPGFEFESRHPALLRGFHRRFCLWSQRYRGTPERPGLVLGLDRGGACRGIVFRVAARQAAEVLAYLDDRELPDGAETVYHRRVLPVQLLDRGGQGVRAVTYVANRACRLYCGTLSAGAAAAAIAEASGRMGPNRDYLRNTVEHLRGMGVRDAGLDRIWSLVTRVADRDGHPHDARPALAAAD
ncbi:MAG TPA: gamma-glutamylcyclotransferase [Acetobacteraceae bacterium]|nr:gamma-glutamylcyclotransferase [Acetobacteraceae bacterium]